MLDTGQVFYVQDTVFQVVMSTCLHVIWVRQENVWEECSLLLAYIGKQLSICLCVMQIAGLLVESSWGAQIAQCCN